MDVGFFSMNTDFGVRIDVMARALEERGFASLWVGEHSHIPVSRATPYPAGGELPRATGTCSTPSCPWVWPPR